MRDIPLEEREYPTQSVRSWRKRGSECECAGNIRPPAGFLQPLQPRHCRTNLRTHKFSRVSSARGMSSSYIHMSRRGAEGAGGGGLCGNTRRLGVEHTPPILSAAAGRCASEKGNLVPTRSDLLVSNHTGVSRLWAQGHSKVVTPARFPRCQEEKI